MINKYIKNYIKKHALEENPNECCGLIFESDGITKACRAKNTSTDKKRSFAVDTVDYYKASLLGDVQAIYHSHSNGNPDFSIKDKELVGQSLSSRAVLLSFLAKKERKIFGVFAKNKGKS